MAKETLNLEVKSNIKSVAKDQKEWNKELKKTEDSIGNVNEEGKETVAEMQILGVSINGLKAAWTSAASGAKFLFRSIKVGIASTGVGLLVLAFGALATWFTKTKKGAEVLSVVFKGIGAAINVIVDRISKFGGGLAKILSGNIRGGLKDMKNSFKGIGTEILHDTILAAGLERQLQKLTDAERELNVETAQRRAEIEELKMIAEDVTKSEEERLDAAKEAFEIENDLLNKRVENAETAVDIQQSQNELNETMAEDLDALADKEIALANIRGESATKQIELNNKINAIEAETKAKRQAAHEERLRQIEEQEKAELERIAAIEKAELDAEITRAEGLVERFKRLKKLEQENFLNRKDDLLEREAQLLFIEREAQIARYKQEVYSQELMNALDEEFDIKQEKLLKKFSDRELAQQQSTANAKLQIENASMDNMSAGIGLVKQMAGENKDIMAGALVAENAVGIAKNIVNTNAANARLTLEGGVAAGPLIAANMTRMWIGIASSVAATITGLSALGKSGATSGGATPSASTEPPAPQMMSGAFELTGGQEVEPVQAYVVSDDITNNQNKLAVIRRRATI